MLNSTLSNGILKALFGITDGPSFPTITYLGLSTSDPGTTGSFTEPSSTCGYKRVLISKKGVSDVQYMALKSDRKISNTKMIMMDMLTGNGGTATHYLLFNTETGGTPYAWGRLQNSLNLQADHIVVFKVGELELELTDSENL